MPAYNLRKKLEALTDLQRRLQESSVTLYWAEQILNRRATRMLATYADLARQSRYTAAVYFLVNDLFGPASLCHQDLGLRKAETTMVRVLPKMLLQTVDKALEFSILTLRLDLQLAEMLTNRLEHGEELSLDKLEAAISSSEDYSGYQRQLRLVSEIGEEIEEVVHTPFISMALKMCRKPAHLMGLGRLQDYLEHGVSAFLKMKGSADFFRIFAERETEYLERVFAKDRF